MAATALVDAGFLVALLSQRDSHHKWAAAQAARHALPWQTCEAAVSETFYLLGPAGFDKLATLMERRAVRIGFDFAGEQNTVLALMKKYRKTPMSLADACLVRMSEIVTDPIVLTTDGDFRIYRRHSRQMIPTAMPRG
jgi:predicted nucleic acid-binding protein